MRGNLDSNVLSSMLFCSVFRGWNWWTPFTCVAVSTRWACGWKTTLKPVLGLFALCCCLRYINSFSLWWLLGGVCMCRFCGGCEGLEASGRWFMSFLNHQPVFLCFLCICLAFTCLASRRESVLKLPAQILEALIKEKSWRQRISWDQTVPRSVAVQSRNSLNLGGQRV